MKASSFTASKNLIVRAVSDFSVNTCVAVIMDFPSYRNAPGLNEDEARQWILEAMEEQAIAMAGAEQFFDDSPDGELPEEEQEEPIEEEEEQQEE